MISERMMQVAVLELKKHIDRVMDSSFFEYDSIMEAIDLIPLGWQVRSNQLDQIAGVAIEHDGDD